MEEIKQWPMDKDELAQVLAEARINNLEPQVEALRRFFFTLPENEMTRRALARVDLVLDDLKALRRLVRDWDLRDITNKEV